MKEATFKLVSWLDSTLWAPLSVTFRNVLPTMCRWAFLISCPEKSPGQPRKKGFGSVICHSAHVVGGRGHRFHWFFRDANWDLEVLLQRMFEMMPGAKPDYPIHEKYLFSKTKAIWFLNEWLKSSVKALRCLWGIFCSPLTFSSKFFYILCCDIWGNHKPDSRG